MTDAPTHAATALNRRYFLDHPVDAARRIETLPPDEVVPVLEEQPVHALVTVFDRLAPDVAAALLVRLADEVAKRVLQDVNPATLVSLLGQFEEDGRERYLGLIDPLIAREARGVMSYPDDSAGRLMETRIGVFRGDMTVAQALERLRASKLRGLHSIFLADDENRLTAQAAIHDLAIAEPDQTLSELARPVLAAVNVTAPREEVVEALETHKLPNVPVIDVAGRLVGVVRYAALMRALEEVATVDIQTMVGASKDERALSKATWAVRKRLPWLQINLLTAFLAASVVGLFEDTIARFTALAVLLPVVAGQSGNAGAQALAVTMRGLALREITVRHWLRVAVKEVHAALLNGLAVAATCAAGVYVWSGSGGLVLVISMSMVLAMVVAGFAGALVPIVLTRLGQDPAQSSSIVLTTVTDVAGFFSFLGIATLLAGMLAA